MSGKADDEAILSYGEEENEAGRKKAKNYHDCLIGTSIKSKRCKGENERGTLRN